MLTQQRLRMYIFAAWIVSFILATFIIASGQWLRRDESGAHIISAESVPDAVYTLSALWIPTLSCLASFWFPKRERRSARDKIITQDHVLGAISLTCIYLLFILCNVAWITYVEDYPMPLTASAPGGQFVQGIHATVKMSAALSPIALAPLHWLTS